MTTALTEDWTPFRHRLTVMSGLSYHAPPGTRAWATVSGQRLRPVPRSSRSILARTAWASLGEPGPWGGCSAARTAGRLQPGDPLQVEIHAEPGFRGQAWIATSRRLDPCPSGGADGE